MILDKLILEFKILRKMTFIIVLGAKLNNRNNLELTEQNLQTLTLLLKNPIIYKILLKNKQKGLF